MASAKTVIGGDDVRALVADCGTWAVRFGSAGDDTPRAIVPSARGVRPPPADTEMTDVSDPPPPKPKASAVAGDILHTSPRAFTDIEPIYQMDESGGATVSNWDAMQAVWESCSSTLDLSLKSSPLFIVEPSRMWSEEERARALEIAFEGCQVPAAFVARGGAMAAFSAARTTACVLDIGHQGIVSVPVLEGFVLKKGVMKSDVGGEVLTKRLEKWMQGVVKDGVKARCELDVERIVGEGHKMFYRQQVVEECKHYTAGIGELGGGEYKLPDGQVIDVGGFGKYAEGLFEMGEKTVSMPELAFRAISACDVDTRRDLFGGVVVVGATSLIGGVVERFTKELAILTPQMYKLKVHASSNSVERSCAAWIGGSIVASLGTFQQTWISKQEYSELGSRIALRKCP